MVKAENNSTNKIILALPLLVLIGCSAPPENKDKKIVFKGSQDKLSLCENDDLELFITADNKFAIRCADQRKVPITLKNGSNIEVGNLDINCNGWCKYDMSLENMTDFTINNSVISK